MTLFLYNRLPDQLAVHFGIDGEADGYQGKFYFLLTSVLFLLAIPLLVKLIRYIDPKKENYDKFETTFDMFRLIFTAFLSVMYVSIIYLNLGYSVRHTNDCPHWNWLVIYLSRKKYVSNSL